MPSWLCGRWSVLAIYSPACMLASAWHYVSGQPVWASLTANTPSSPHTSHQSFSIFLGMFYLLLICILAFTNSVSLIKYRMPSEEAHHPFIKCSQQQLFEQAESLPIPPPPNLVPHVHGHQSVPMMASPTTSLPPPPPQLNSHCYAPKNDPQFHAV